MDVIAVQQFVMEPEHTDVRPSHKRLLKGTNSKALLDQLWILWEHDQLNCTVP